VIIIESLNWVL